MTGINIGLWGGLSADVGYRYAKLGFHDFGDKRLKDVAGGRHSDLIRFQRHDFRMGLRYAF